MGFQKKKKDLGRRGGKKGKERERRRRKEEEKGVEEREWGIETSSYNRLLGGVMKQLSDAFYFLLLSLLQLCLSSSVFSSSSPSPQLCLFCLLTLSYAFPFFSFLSICFLSISHLSLLPPLFLDITSPLCLFSISLSLLMFPFVSFCPFCLLKWLDVCLFSNCLGTVCRTWW